MRDNNAFVIAYKYAPYGAVSFLQAASWNVIEPKKQIIIGNYPLKACKGVV